VGREGKGRKEGREGESRREGPWLAGPHLDWRQGGREGGRDRGREGGRKGGWLLGIVCSRPVSGYSFPGHVDAKLGRGVQTA
jgi:hypothetical protein